MVKPVLLAAALAAISAPPVAADPVLTGQRGTVSRVTYGCFTLEALEKLVSLANARDDAAFDAYAKRERCKVLMRGTAITVETTSVLRGASCARPDGMLACVWIPLDRTTRG